MCIGFFKSSFDTLMCPQWQCNKQANMKFFWIKNAAGKNQPVRLLSFMGISRSVIFAGRAATYHKRAPLIAPVILRLVGHSFLIFKHSSYSRMYYLVEKVLFQRAGNWKKRIYSVYELRVLDGDCM